ncbi:hypothetical protein ACQI5H_22750 [Mycobacterium heidelbergense]|uniref:hypothetical protein n=1 Tax=Mycobacterium heidelbergense TaxID=53376 RepID=UPI003CEEB447
MDLGSQRSAFLLNCGKTKMIRRVEIDFGEAWDFLDDAGRPRHLRFRRNWAPPGDARVFAETGQLVAVIGDVGRSDNFDELAISGPNVSYAAIQAALDGWQEWAMVLDAGDYCWISLAQIQRRVNQAGLGPHPPD